MPAFYGETGVSESWMEEQAASLGLYLKSYSVFRGRGNTGTRVILGPKGPKYRHVKPGTGKPTAGVCIHGEVAFADLVSKAVPSHKVGVGHDTFTNRAAFVRGKKKLLDYWEAKLPCVCSTRP